MESKSKTLLVIDDEAAVRESIAAYLEDSGYQIAQAENGELGVKRFDQGGIDLVLCDLRMPKMDGLSVLKSIREQDEETPFIVVSGAGVMSDVVEALRLGASDYLIKPIVDLAVLEHSVSRALENLQLKLDNLNYRDNLEQANEELSNSLAELREDQRAGREIQRKMLPVTPYAIDKYEMSYHISPSLYLSGDFVDYIPLGGGRFGFYLADVSGHGASSAFVTVLLKHMSMAMRREYRQRRSLKPVTPSEVLAYINRGLLKTNLGKHVTVFGGIVDTKLNTLTYSFGGHYPLPVLACGDKVHFIEGRGLPVGIFDAVKYEDTTIELPESFSLVGFSDGILEVLPFATLDEKEAHILEVVQRARTVDEIRAAFHLDDITDAPDDIAVFVMERKA